MSVNQYRVGPYKVNFLGIRQPILDGFKLFLKIINYPNKNSLVFYLSPCISFIISFIFWVLLFSNSILLKNIIILFIFGIGIYSFVLRGWSRFSKFGYIGRIRARAQTISYEICLAILLLIIIIFLGNFTFINFNENMFYILFPLFLSWGFTVISETNRAPFDFAEGERELISGFNIEYGSAGFVLFFLREYNIIIFFRILTVLLFNINFLIFFIILFILISLRTTFPRFRYDFLQEFIWFKMLPLLCLLLLLISFLNLDLKKIYNF